LDAQFVTKCGLDQVSVHIRDVVGKLLGNAQQHMVLANSIVVENSGAASLLTECLNFPPVKFINPRPLGGCCQVYISNYGGGLVDGDAIQMKVDCRPGSRLYLGSQSSTKVYRSHGNKGCLQETVGSVGAGSLAVVCPDPVVPFEGSRYRQSQVWRVHPEGDLILFDWLQPGRAARGEVFAYHHVRSDLRVLRPGGDPLLIERFCLEPGKQDPLRCGHFGPFTSLLCIYAVGARASRLMESLEPGLLALNRPPAQSERNTGATWVGMGRRENVGWVIRAMGGERRDVQPVQDMVFEALSQAPWLGFNPWNRRW
jgi:urease accessory protein